MKKAHIKPLQEFTVTEKGNPKYHVDDTEAEVYEEPDYSIQHSNSIQLRHNVGYSQQPHYE